MNHFSFGSQILQPTFLPQYAVFRHITLDHGYPVTFVALCTVLWEKPHLSVVEIPLEKEQVPSKPIEFCL